MVKFFIPKPYANTEKEAHHAHLCMRNFARRSTGLDTTDRKVYQIQFVQDGDLYEARVGRPEYGSGETVVAILEADDEYLICTPTQGGYRGKPVVVAKDETVAVQDFEDRPAHVRATERGTK